MTALDLLLIHEYTGGINVPIASQAGYRAHVNATGNNLEYRALSQALAASGTWDGNASTIVVSGAGARSIALPLPIASRVGQEVLVVDLIGNANTGNITVTFTGAVLASGVPVISASFGKLRLLYAAVGTWMLVT